MLLLPLLGLLLLGRLLLLPLLFYKAERIESKREGQIYCRLLVLGSRSVGGLDSGLLLGDLICRREDVTRIERQQTKEVKYPKSYCYCRFPY